MHNKQNFHTKHDAIRDNDSCDLSSETLLVIEDEADIRELLQYNLERAGYHVVLAADGLQGLSQAKQHPPDLVILDIMLPKIDGLEVCRKLRTLFASRYVPIMMLTAKGDESDTVSGLNAGADDYVVKPFQNHELLARIQAHLRRYNINRQALHNKTTLTKTTDLQKDMLDASSNPLLQLGPLAIDEAQHIIYLENKPLMLTLSEFRILATFIAAPGIVFSRSELISKITDHGVHITARNIDVHILSLRKKLGDHATLIQTIRGVGYKCQALT